MNNARATLLDIPQPTATHSTRSMLHIDKSKAPSLFLNLVYSLNNNNSSTVRKHENLLGASRGGVSWGWGRIYQQETRRYGQHHLVIKLHKLIIKGKRKGMLNKRMTTDKTRWWTGGWVEVHVAQPGLGEREGEKQAKKRKTKQQTMINCCT